MFGKIIIIFVSLIALVQGTANCPSPVPSSPAVACVFVPDCQFAENGTVTPLGTQCANELPDADCEQLFPCDSSGSPACDPTQAIANPTPDGYPYVRAPACTNPSLYDVAMKCKYING